MKLFPFFSATYVVVAVDPDYQWAAVAHPSRKFGWILARETSVPDFVWQQLFERFTSLGYKSSQFVRVPQPHSEEMSVSGSSNIQ
jgi:apolipoprotein D and lipocalin family protein